MNKTLLAVVVGLAAALNVPVDTPKTRADGQECCEVLSPAFLRFGAPIPCGFFPFCFKTITSDTGTGACGSAAEGFSLLAPPACNQDINIHQVQTNSCAGGGFFALCLPRTIVIAMKKTTYCGAAPCPNDTSNPPPPPPPTTCFLQGAGGADTLALR